MNSRNSLKQWLARRRVKDFFLSAAGGEVSESVPKLSSFKE